MILSFASKAAEAIFNDLRSAELPSTIQKTARRKLVQVHIAHNLNDLRVPPGNRLEPLKGARLGQHSIRINAKWRVCFEWTSNGAMNVEIVDYH
jgi:toxin HigB-1